MVLSLRIERVRAGSNTHNYGSDGRNRPGLYQPWMVVVRSLFPNTLSYILLRTVSQQHDVYSHVHDVYSHALDCAVSGAQYYCHEHGNPVARLAASGCWPCSRG